MKLKGTAEIQIINKDGTVAHREKHTNTITQALQKIFENNLGATVDYRKLTPILDKLIGGVCAWDGILDETSIYLPKQTNATLTAHAGQHTYASASDDPTRGNPSTSDEDYGPTEDGNGFTWVWTFDESQGVGDITGLTLTHSDVGDYYNQLDSTTLPSDFEPVEDASNYILNANTYGYDAGSPQASALPKVVGLNLPRASSDDPIHGLDKIPLGFYKDKNHVVSVEMVEDREDHAGIGGGDWRYGHYNIYISRFNGDEIWLRDTLGDLRPEEEKTIAASVQWQWANTTSLGRGIHYLAYDEEIRHLYIFTLGIPDYVNWDPYPSQSTFWYRWWPFAPSFQYKDINLDTGEIETKQSGAIGTAIWGYCFRIHEEAYEPIVLKVIDGKIILPKYTVHSKIVRKEVNPGEWVDVEVPDCQATYNDTTPAGGVRVNMRTGAIEDYLEGPIAYEGNNGRSYTSQIGLGSDRVMFPNALIERTPTQEGSAGFPRNYRSRTVTRTTAIFGTDNRTSRLYTAQKSDSLILYGTLPIRNQGGDRLRGAILNKMYQASVYRLNAKVTKGNDQTMKIIYRIEQEEEQP